MESFEISEKDLEEENELFNDPESRRKRKRFTKEDAIYGIWKESNSEEEDYNINNNYSKGKYNTGISFVKGQLTNNNNNSNNYSDSSSSSSDENFKSISDSDNDDSSDSDSDNDSKNSKKDDDKMDEDTNETSTSSFQGLGFGNSAGQGLGFGNSTGQGLGFGNSTGQGLGFGNSTGQGFGFGNSEQSLKSNNNAASSMVVPTEFSSSKNKKEKKRKEKTYNSTATYKPKLKVDKDFGKFEQYTKGIGLKLLMKQGYVPGEGLGVNKDGITAPIDVKLRPKGQGLSFNNFDEMTENDKIQQKEYKKKYAAELKAKGIKMDIGLDEIDENVIEEENELEARPKTEAWKKGKKNKKKVTLYKTVDEIIREEAELSDKMSNIIQPQPMKIVDMTKKEVRIISDTSQLSSDNKISIDKYFEINEHLPELRHNIKLITDLTQADLMYILKQLKIEETKRKSLEQRYSQKAEQLKLGKIKIEKVKKIDSIMKEIKNIYQEIMKEFKLLEKRKILNQYQSENPTNNKELTEVQKVFSNIKNNILTVKDGNELFTILDKRFSQLESEYEIFFEFKLDRLLVSVINPIFKKMLLNWNPLEDRYLCIDYFIKWKKLLLIKSQDEKNDNDSSYLFILSSQKDMTCFESLLYNNWLPKIRQTINNDWDPKNPDSLIKLLEEWEVILPQWLKNNIIEQLIIPKLKFEVDHWIPQNYFKDSSNNNIPLHSYLIPWLVVIDEDKMHLHLFEIVKNKLIVYLHNKPFLETENDGGKFILQNLCSWLEVLTKEDFTDILTQCVLPELVRHLRYNFFINPAKQDIQPLMQVLSWSEFVPEMLMTKIITSEFFPKWYKILAMWLKSGEESGNEPNYNEIAAWYKSWKDILKDINGLDIYWKQGLDMMNQGPSCKIPIINSLDDEPLLSNTKISQLMNNNSQQEKPKGKLKPQLSLKEYIEKELEKEDCLLEPSRIIHESGKTLYNIIKVYYEPISKKKTIYNLYIDDGVLFIKLAKSEANNYMPIGINDLIEKIRKLT
ncbi:TFP11-domain-containing protein [Anaeromyces robustus]|uniref:TFP11-domain-containing protein n=1 Tax=Anaeromyces robustus TaxID=1754192 RepID=A0A1Y1WQ01_9FUNG|nr:TFP11-domain-containing protein [Anaeromyces robustus]|eukprot:ORX75368.1 TFP11-domain-containing protein [Anaeromyces robustus]